MKATNIIWDLDGDDYNENLELPTEIEIPEGMESTNEISDYLSDVTGFCHKGFNLVETANIIVSKEKVDMINDLLELTGYEIYQKCGLKRDETITDTAKFPNGIEVDIKVVICEDDYTPYTEGVMFCNGTEVACIDGENGYDGEWWFEYDGVQYLVNVVVEDYLDADTDAEEETESKFDELKSGFEKLSTEIQVPIGLWKVTLNSKEEYETLLDYFYICNKAWAGCVDPVMKEPIEYPYTTIICREKEGAHEYRIDALKEDLKKILNDAEI